MKRKTLVALGCLVVVAAALAAGLGMSRAQAAPKLTHVTLQLKWVTQAQFAGYYAAVEKGYYKDAGLDVPVVVGGIIPPEDARALKQFGVAAVYTPKDFELNRIMSDLVQIVEGANTD